VQKTACGLLKNEPENRCVLHGYSENKLSSQWLYLKNLSLKTCNTITMNDLHELIKFVTSEARINPAVLQKMFSQQKEQKMSRLVTAMQQEHITDEEALKKVYGNSGSSGRYRVLKTRLKDRLLNLVFMSDNSLSFKNAYPQAYFRLSRNILAGKFLILKDQRKQGIAMLKQALNTAVYLQLSFEAIECCMLICFNAAYNGLTKELAYYQKINDAEMHIFRQEHAMEVLYNSSLLRQIKMAGYDRKLQMLLKKNFIAARQICKKCSSFKTRLLYHRIAYYYYHSIGRFREVIKMGSAFISYLHLNSHLNEDARYGEFMLYVMEGYMRLHDFDSAKKFAAQCAKKYPQNSTPWVQFMKYYFLTAMRTGKIAVAKKIHYHITTSTPAYKKLPGPQKEQWTIFGAYLHFASHNDLPRKQFNLFKFLNEVPHSNQDKPGYNFSILLAYVILLLHADDHNKLGDARFAFRNYFRRYIKKDESPRSFYFGCMMIQLFKNNFNFKKKDPVITVYLKKLKGVKATSLPLEETEVIPYPVLWQMLKEKTEHEQWAIEDGLQTLPQIVAAWKFFFTCCQLWKKPRFVKPAAFFNRFALILRGVSQLLSGF
jgi:hypothetical protein